MISSARVWLSIWVAPTPHCAQLQLCLRMWHQDRTPQGHFSGMEMADPSRKWHLFTLSQLGWQAKQFTGHRFWIGAATAVAQAGLEDSAIQAVERGSSAAFLLYIRTPREQLAQFTTRIANQQRTPPMGYSKEIH